MDALLVGLVPGLPENVRVTIRDRADGIPLYAVETVRMLLDRGLLAREGDAYVVDGDLDALAVPETLHALIAARLDGLEPEERALLERAAVLGKTFSSRGLARLGGLEEQDVERVLAILVRKEVLTLDTDPRSPERGQYGFLQALVQRVAYETLSRHDRRALHLAAADHLAEDAGIDPDEIAEVIAAHLRDADRADPGAADAAEMFAHARASGSSGQESGPRPSPRPSMRGAPSTRRSSSRMSRPRGARSSSAPATSPSTRTRWSWRSSASRRLDPSSSSEGQTHAAARATGRMSLALWNLGRSDEAAEHIERAFAVMAEDEHDEDFASVAAEAGPDRLVQRGSGTRPWSASTSHSTSRRRRTSRGSSPRRSTPRHWRCPTTPTSGAPCCARRSRSRSSTTCSTPPCAPTTTS